MQLVTLLIIGTVCFGCADSGTAHHAEGDLGTGHLDTIVEAAPSDSARADLARADFARPDSARADATRADATSADATSADATSADATSADATSADAASADTVGADAQGTPTADASGVDAGPSADGGPTAACSAGASCSPGATCGAFDGSQAWTCECNGAGTYQCGATQQVSTSCPNGQSPECGYSAGEVLCVSTGASGCRMVADFVLQGGCWGGGCEIVCPSTPRFCGAACAPGSPTCSCLDSGVAVPCDCFEFTPGQGVWLCQ